MKKYPVYPPLPVIGECHPGRWVCSQTAAPHRSAADAGSSHWVPCMPSSPSTSAGHEAATSSDVPWGRPALVLSCDFCPYYSGLEPGRQARPSALHWWTLMPAAVPPPGSARSRHSDAASGSRACWGKHQGTWQWHWPHAWCEDSWWCHSQRPGRQSPGRELLPGSLRGRWWGCVALVPAGPFVMSREKGRGHWRLRIPPAGWQGPSPKHWAGRNSAGGLGSPPWLLHCPLK